MLREEAMFLQSVAENLRLLYSKKKKTSFLKQIFTNKNTRIPQGVISQLFSSFIKENVIQRLFLS